MLNVADILAEIEKRAGSPDEVAEQYSDYMRHFDIPREQQGLRRGNG